MTKSLPAALLLALTIAAPAAAQDATAFAGPRVEALVGWDQLRFNLSDVSARPGRSHTADLAFGGAVGYDVTLSPRLVGGVEASVEGSDVNRAVGGGDLHQRREVDVLGRLGLPVNGSTLLYAKAGYGNLQLRETRTASGAVSDTLRDLDGVVLGAGVEVKMSPRTYIKSEYRYGNYADNVTSNQVLTGIGLRF